MANQVDVTQNWNLDYEKLPGSRLNIHAFRFFSVHPDIANCFTLCHPNETAFVYRDGVKTDLLEHIGTVPAENPAITQPLFVRRKL